MKKRYLISLLLLICLVGCASIGGHKLTCTSIGKGPAMTIDQNMYLDMKRIRLLMLK